MKRFIPLLLFIGLIFGGVKTYNYFADQQVLNEENTNKISPVATVSPEKTSVQSTDVSKPNSQNPNPMIINDKKSYQAKLTTSVGDITIELNTKNTPITANNFISLAKKGFYNNTIFHRVISGFMIQGGDPKGNGTGGPGYKFDDEPFEGDYSRGTVAMANSGPNTNGSQFFIMHADYPLPKNYVIFGKVISGLETVDKIADAPVKSNPASGEESVPIVPVTIKSIDVIEN